MRRALFALVCLVVLVTTSVSRAEDNSTPAMARSVQDQPNGSSASALGALPLDIQGKGSDQSGTLLSFKLKEEVMASRLFALTASDKKKFVLHLLTQPEFPDRPGIASQYSIVLVYQEDSGTLTYYLNHMQGLVHPEGVTAEMQKILEWTYSTVKRFHYLLEE